MAEPNKQQIGDGADNFGQAAGQMAKAAKQAGQETAKQAAAKGAEATANAAAATVKAGVEGGKAVAEVAAGTAAGGPVGAVISAAWSLRHTLFKVLICICLAIVFFIVLIVSLPSIVTNNIFGLDGTQPVEGMTLDSSYTQMEQVVSNVIEAAYQMSLSRVEQIISSGGYNYEASSDATINYAQSSAGYDTCYILAAYSASLEQQGTDPDDMTAKLNSVASDMFPVTYEVKETEQTITNEDGTTSVQTVQYVECTIHPFDNSVINRAFGIDPNAAYNQFGATYSEVITNMANALKRTLYGAISPGESVPLTDEELIAFVNSQSCTGVQKLLLETALSLVGKVPYFWGGKSPAGWNDEWNTPKLVTSAGSSSTGTIRPYGLDCSGFTSWIYDTALGIDIGAGTGGQYPKTTAVSAADLQIGDLGFLAGSGGGGWNHVLMFAGYGSSGERMWVHSSSGSGVILNSPSYESSLVLRRPKNVDYNAPVAGGFTGIIGPSSGTPYTMEVEVTHYCPCQQCNGNSLAMSASGKPLAVGMVAMSTKYPFGTRISINGKIYTVEDRGGAEFNDIHRVDIFVNSHEEALRLGRYKTTATVYPTGR